MIITVDPSTELPTIFHQPMLFYNIIQDFRTFVDEIIDGKLKIGQYHQFKRRLPKSWIYEYIVPQVSNRRFLLKFRITENSDGLFSFFLKNTNTYFYRRRLIKYFNAMTNYQAGLPPWYHLELRAVQLKNNMNIFFGRQGYSFVILRRRINQHTEYTVRLISKLIKN